MQKKVTEMRKKLSAARDELRDHQRKSEKDQTTLSDTTSYCRVCELNFRTDPKDHESNEIHEVNSKFFLREVFLVLKKILFSSVFLLKGFGLIEDFLVFRKLKHGFTSAVMCAISISAFGRFICTILLL